MSATELRIGSTVISLHDRLTVVTGADGAALDALADAVAAGEATLVGGEPSGATPRLHRLPSVRLGEQGPSSASATVHAEVAAAEAALRDAQAGLRQAETAYTDAQDRLLSLRREADRGAQAALEEAEHRVSEAQDGAASARRALSAAREEAASREADLGAVRELEERRRRLQARREEMAARMLRLPPVIDTEPISKSLEGLRRLREVKPRPLARAVEIADRLQAITEQLAAMGVDPPPDWLSGPSLDALRTARRDLQALESGKPTVAVDPEKVQAVEDAHARVLEAEAKVMDKGSRANRRRLEEVTAAERATLHALGLSSYDQFLKYLAPTLDAGARQERLAEARASVGDAETVWAELHGGSVPEGWTDLHLERVTLVEEAATILGTDTVGAEGLDQALRSHLEAVVDTTWAEDALSNALAAANVALAGGGLEAAAERVLAEAPAAREERERAEGELAAIDAELAGIAEEMAALAPLSFLQAQGDTGGDAGAGSGGEGDRGGDADGDGERSGFIELEAMTRVAAAALETAEAALTEARHRAEQAASARALEEEAAQRAEAAKAVTEEARTSLAGAEHALAGARAAADEASSAASAAATAAEAAVHGARLEARLSLLARAAGQRASASALVVAGSADALGGPAPAAALLGELAGALQVVVIDRAGELTEAVAGLGDGARVVTV